MIGQGLVGAEQPLVRDEGRYRLPVAHYDRGDATYQGVVDPGAEGLADLLDTPFWPFGHIANVQPSSVLKGCKVTIGL